MKPLLVVQIAYGCSLIILRKVKWYKSSIKAEDNYVTIGVAQMVNTSYKL